MKFTTSSAAGARRTHRTKAIIFGQWTQTELGPEDARAFLRHAYGEFYHDFSNVDLKDHTFVWQYTYRNALLAFRDAALRYAHRIKVLHATRIYSTLPETTPLEARERYPNIMTINADGSSKLTSAFQKAIDDAKAEADRVAAAGSSQQRPRLRRSATASPRQRGVSPGGGGGGRGLPPQQIAEGRGGVEGSHFSLHITQSSMLCLYSPHVACVPWLLGWF